MPYYQDIFGLRTTFLLGDFSLSGIGHARDLVSLFQWNLDEGMNCAAAARVPLLDDDTIWTLYRRRQDAGIEGLVRRFGLPTKRDLTGAVGALGQRDIAAGPRARLAGSLIRNSALRARAGPVWHHLCDEVTDKFWRHRPREFSGSQIDEI